MDCRKSGSVGSKRPRWKNRKRFAQARKVDAEGSAQRSVTPSSLTSATCRREGAKKMTKMMIDCSHPFHPLRSPDSSTPNWSLTPTFSPTLDQLTPLSPLTSLSHSLFLVVWFSLHTLSPTLTSCYSIPRSTDIHLVTCTSSLHFPHHHLNHFLPHQ